MFLDTVGNLHWCNEFKICRFPQIEKHYLKATASSIGIHMFLVGLKL